MKNRVELKQYIRFQLAQMSARNDQHLFERMSFEIARQRICVNLLPATGPVQAGGDQGRDFETYPSFLGMLSDDVSAFSGLANGEPLVFACTLNKDLPSKIKADLAQIFSGGDRPSAVYYFAEPDLPVAKRHSLKKHCLDTYGARLEIFDGQAIADILADAAVFWVAEQFLAVPADLFPVILSNDEYAELRAKWFGGMATPVNYADFLEIKRGLREATFTEPLKADLSRWLDLMRLFASPGPLQRKAWYELSVAQLRGRGSLDPETGSVQAFFRELPDDASANELNDAVVLAGYCGGALQHGAFNLPSADVSAWLARLERQIRRQMESRELSAPDRYKHLHNLGYLEMQPLHGDLPLEEKFGKAACYWNEALGIAEHQPFCEVSTFVRLLEVLVPIVGQHPDFQPLADRTDRLIALREGKAAAAERCRARAIAHAEAGHKLAAIDQLQRAKEGWFNAETMGASVISMLLLAQWYRELHLPFAARYYASAALFVASNTDNEAVHPLMERAAFEVAASFLFAGESITYLAAVSSALQLHGALVVNPGDGDEHPHLPETLEQAMALRAIFLKLAPQLVELVDRTLESWELPPDLLSALKSQSEDMAAANDRAHFEQLIIDELGQSPFNDLGPRVSIRWRALGIEWTLCAETKYRAAAENVAAALQLLQVELADVDLLIVPSNVTVTINVNATATKPNFRQRPDNGRLQWDVAIPMSGDDIRSTLMVVMTILGQVTALDDSKFFKLLEAHLERGLTNRIFWVRPAEELLGNARTLARYSFDPATTIPPEDYALPPPVEADELAWREAPGPGYSAEKAAEYLKNRYSVLLPFGKSILPKLMADERCRGLISNLHSAGCLDWQILSYLLNIVAQVRAERIHGRMDERRIHRFRTFLKEQIDYLGTGADPEFEPQELTVDLLRAQENLLTVAASKTWDLVNHRQTPDFAAIKKLLDVRYGHSTDDLPHENIFGWE